MRHRWTGLLVLCALLLSSAGIAQFPPDIEIQQQGANAPKRLPDGRLQSEAILKSQLKDSLKDVDEILKLADELKRELEKNSTHVLSVSAIRKAEDIEKLAKRLKGRLRN